MQQMPAFKNNYFLYSTATLLAVLPFKKLVVPILIINILAWLLNDTFCDKIARLKQNNSFWLFVLPFIFYLIGMVYSENQLFGWKDIELKLSLFIFPLLYASTTFPFHKFKKLLGLVFVSSMTFTGLISIVYGAIVFNQLPTYEMIDLFLHPSYLAMYCNLALVITYFLFDRTDLSHNENRFLRFAFFILSVTILLSLSKTGLLTWILLIGGMIFYNLVVIKKQYMGSLLLLIFGFALMLVAYNTVPQVKDRFYYAFSAVKNTQAKQVDESTSESTQIRILIWQQAIELIKENPLMGTGTGDIKDELFVKYEAAGMQGALDNKLNVHNQYLQVFATLGLIGLVLFIASFILPFIIALKRKNRLFLAFIFIFSINLLFESMLEKQDGVIFYAFFNALLFFHFQPKTNQQSSLKS
ncbi:MAG: O-antigen ligase family protein [Vicingaceae bacterium]